MMRIRWLCPLFLWTISCSLIAGEASPGPGLPLRLPGEALFYARIDPAALRDLLADWSAGKDVNAGKSCGEKAREAQRSLLNLLGAEELEPEQAARLCACPMHLVVLGVEGEMPNPEPAECRAVETAEPVPDQARVETLPQAELTVDPLPPEMCLDEASAIADSLPDEHTRDDTVSGESRPLSEARTFLGARNDSRRRPRPRLVVCVVFHVGSEQASAMAEVCARKANAVAAGPHLVFSDGDADPLIRVLSAPRKDLSGAPIYGVEPPSMPPMGCLIDIKAAGRFVASRFRYDEESLAVRLNARADTEGMAPEAIVAYEEMRGTWRLAREDRKRFALIRKVLGFERLPWLGARVDLVVEEQRSKVTCEFLLARESPSAPLLAALLDGGQALTPPPYAWEEAACVMGRMDWAKVYEKGLPVLEPRFAQAFLMLQMAAKAQLGHDLQDLLPRLAGDVYAWFAPAVRGDNAAVETLLLVGLRDPEGMRKALGAMAAGAQELKQTRKYLSVREIEGQAAYCIGRGMNESRVVPDGVESMTVVIRGRYLLFGSWSRIRNVLRRWGEENSRAGMALPSKTNFYARIPPQVCLALMAHSRPVMTSWNDAVWTHVLRRFGRDDEAAGAACARACGDLAAALRSLIVPSKAVFSEGIVLTGRMRGDVYVLRLRHVMEPSAQ